MDLLEELKALSESEAVDIMHELRRHHGWQGTMWQEADLEDLWNETRRAEGMECGERWSVVRENVLSQRGWTRWFTEWMVEKGNEYLADWISELDENGKERSFGS